MERKLLHSLPGHSITTISFLEDSRKTSVQRFEELYAQQIGSACRAVTSYSRLDRGSLSQNHRRWRRRCWNRQAQKLIRARGPRTSQERPGSADIDGFREIEEFNSSSIYATNEHRNLQMNPRRTPTLNGGYAHTLSFKTRSGKTISRFPRRGTCDLVPCTTIARVWRKWNTS